MPKKLDDATAGAKLLKLFFRLLADNKKHYQTDLAKFLNCSTQTVMRLCDEIEQFAGDKFKSGKDQGKRYYQLEPTGFLNGFLKHQGREASYLNLFLEIVEEYMPPETRILLQKSLLDFAALTHDLNNPAKSLEAKGLFTFNSKGHIDNSSHFDTISAILKAIEKKQILTIGYKAAGKKNIKHHLFAPARMVSMSGAFYVFGACVANEKEPRHFTNFCVHRIVSIDDPSLTRKFAIDTSNLNGFGLKWHDPETFRLYFKEPKACDYVKERIFAENQQIIDKGDGTLILELTTCSRRELKSFVRSFDNKARPKLFDSRGFEVDPFCDDD